jgi:hypothetical protein
MKPLPEIPPGPEAWKRFAAGVLAALRARTPLRSPTNEIDEKADGFMVHGRRAKVSAPERTPTFTADLDGTETVPDGGIFRVIQIFDTGLPDGTPVVVDTPGLIFPVMLVGSSVDGGTITLNYWSAYGSATMAAGTITVRPSL